MSSAVITAGGISVRPHKPIKGKVPSTRVDTVTVQGPDLVWKKPAEGSANFTTGIGSSGNGFTWNDGNVGNNVNPPALNTFMHSGVVTTINASDVWGICVNRLPNVVQQHAAINEGTVQDKGNSLWTDLAWAENCRKYNRYRVLKCEITFRPIGGQSDNSTPVLFGINRVYSNGEKNNRPISVNKPYNTTDVNSVAIGTPFTLFDARSYRGGSKDQCVGGGWVKIGDPREPRVEPFKVTWDRMPWFYNARFQEHMQEAAYDTTLLVTDFAEAAEAGDTDSYARADSNLLGFKVDRPVYYEPYIIPMAGMNQGPAGTANLWWRIGWSAKYTVEFSDPVQWEEDVGEFSFNNYQQATLWGTSLGAVWGKRADIGATENVIFTSEGEKNGVGTYVPAIHKELGNL